MSTESGIDLCDGTVVEVLEIRPGASVVRVDLGAGRLEEAVSYHALTGPLEGGERVTLNTTAVRLGLGTGGMHFVCAVHGRRIDSEVMGHIMKVRYTPSQLRVLSVEEEASPHRAQMEEIPDLAGTPVLVGTLHSQVPILAACLKAQNRRIRVAYVMTDGAALPAAFSKVAWRLRSCGLLDAILTCGHAFGGDLECVTPQSALAAAKSVIQADAIIVAMGPGVVGTGTPLGTTALEQGPLLDIAGALGGAAIAVARVSGRDKRERHLGMSHHTRTALIRFTARPCRVALPSNLPGMWRALLEGQAREVEEADHIVAWEEGESVYELGKNLLRREGIEVTTMGRTDRDDPLFFWTTAAAAALAFRLDQHTSA